MQQLLHYPKLAVTHVHEGSGNKLDGIRLSVGNRIRWNDRYADPCGGWLQARPQDIGNLIEQGCTTHWIRPA